MGTQEKKPKGSEELTGTAKAGGVRQFLCRQRMWREG